MVKWSLIALSMETFSFFVVARFRRLYYTLLALLLASTLGETVVLAMHYSGYSMDLEAFYGASVSQRAR